MLIIVRTYGFGHDRDNGHGDTGMLRLSYHQISAWTMRYLENLPRTRPFYTFMMRVISVR